MQKSSVPTIPRQMRLNSRARTLLIDTARKAMAARCTITPRARNCYVARRIFEAATPHLAEYGAKADRDTLTWNFPNGSTVRIVVDGTHA